MLLHDFFDIKKPKIKEDSWHGGGDEPKDAWHSEAGVAENTATGINKMFNNLGDPVYSNLQRVALLAMQGRQSEAAGRLQSVIKDASTDIQKKITDAVNNIKPVTINGKIADSSTLDKSKQHNDWIINTFIPWVQSLLGKQGVAEGSLNEFAPGSSNGGGDDSLFNYAKMWYNGDLKTQQQVEKALQKSGLDIGENEDENGGAYISDMSGDYYESWTAEDLEQGVAEGWK